MTKAASTSATKPCSKRDKKGFLSQARREVFSSISNYRRTQGRSEAIGRANAAAQSADIRSGAHSTERRSRISSAGINFGRGHAFRLQERSDRRRLSPEPPYLETAMPERRVRRRNTQIRHPSHGAHLTERRSRISFADINFGRGHAFRLQERSDRRRLSPEPPYLETAMPERRVRRRNTQIRHPSHGAHLTERRSRISFADINFGRGHAFRLQERSDRRRLSPEPPYLETAMPERRVRR